MSKQHKKDKKDTSEPTTPTTTATIKDRKILKISVFKDEWEKVGIAETMNLKDACGTVRKTLGLDENRQKMGNPSKALLKDMQEKMTYEELQKVYAQLKEDNIIKDDVPKKEEAKIED